MNTDFDTLFEALKLRYHDHIDPTRSAYIYLSELARTYTPAETIKSHLYHLQKDA